MNNWAETLAGTNQNQTWSVFGLVTVQEFYLTAGFIYDPRWLTTEIKDLAQFEPFQVRVEEPHLLNRPGFYSMEILTTDKHQLKIRPTLNTKFRAGGSNETHAKSEVPTSLAEPNPSETKYSDTGAPI